MDRTVAPEVIRRRRLKRYLGATLVAAILIIAFLMFKSLLTPTLDRSKILTSVAEVGRIEATLSASGVVVPEHEHVIGSPIRTEIDAVFLQTGETVAKDQQILKLNCESLELEFAKYEDELELEKTRKQQLTLRLQQQGTELEAKHEIKRLQVEYMKTQLRREQQLLAAGASNKTILEQAELNCEITQRELDLLTSQIENQQAALQAELRALDLEIRIRENKLAEIRRLLSLAEVRADHEGVLTWVKDDIGSTVNAGEVIARIADLSSFMIEARISDIHADRLRVGGQVRIRISETILNGKISAIQPTVDNGIMSFLVELEDSDHELLRPNLRADVFVVTAFKDSVLRVVNGPFYHGTVDQEVFIIDGDRAVRKIVAIGESNYDYVELKGDIHPGDEVIISDMRKYRHLDQVSLNNR